MHNVKAVIGSSALVALSVHLKGLMKSKNVLGIACTTFALVGCGTTGQAPTIISGVVTVEENTATKANHVPSFATPTDASKVCGADKQFLGELRDVDPDQSKVSWEWAPIMPGGPKWPVVNEPYFWVAGTIEELTPPKGDIPFSHPFGDDYSFDIKVDAAYNDLVYKGPEEPGILHSELESGLFPHQNYGLWYYPAKGDRVVAYGNWIIDCGHPQSYGSELHPPVMLAFGRVNKEANRTESHAFAVPYYTTQLYYPDAGKASDVGDQLRFQDSDVKPFPAYLKDEIVRNLKSQHDHLIVHPMVSANDFGVVGWWVCAPQPKPANAVGIYVHWHYTVRNGVGLVAMNHEDIGCVQFIATQGPDYKPMPLARMDRSWEWSSINALAQQAAKDPSLDVHQKIRDETQKILATMALDPAGLIAWAVAESHIDATPIIDSYAPLSTLLDYHVDQGEGITVSDAQPFPFYGWANVSWRTPLRLPERTLPH